jgi:acetyltransferase
MTDATATAEKLKAFGHVEGKPVLASWMGGDEVAAGEAILNRADIPTFAYPDTAAVVFTSMWQYSENLRALYETPVPSADPADLESGRARAQAMIDAVKKADRTILTEAESKDLLGCYGIPTVVTKIAKTEAAAAKVAKEIGFPIVLKLYSETITHKTDVGGVQLNLKDEADVRKAFNDIKTAVTEKKGAKHFQGVTVQKMIKLTDGYEIILGSSIDPQFGPVLLFGMGGQLVEIFKDKSLALPPLNTTLARRMMERTKIYQALKGVRGRKPVDLAALEKLMVGFSQLVAEQRWIKEIDINPMFASGDDLVALDARIILHDPKTTEDQLPKLAIRPYPTQYAGGWEMKDGKKVTIRPIRPEDEPMVVKFHEGLSERSVYLRYFSPLKLQQRVAHSRLIRICFNDYDREIALVAEVKGAEGQSEVVAIARLSKLHSTSAGEFAVVVIDQWQRKGLGTEMTKRLIQIAKNEKLTRLVAYTLRENKDMQHMCKKVGFKVRTPVGESECIIEMDL